MKKLTVIFLVLALALALVTVLPVHGEEKIYDSVIRLHVLANSDSPEDQAAKLLVRDAVLAESRTLLEGKQSREAAAAALESAKPQLEAAAAAALAAKGISCDVKVTLTTENYPTRQYEGLCFPAGDYLSLRVMLGEAKGQNWWCVVFPPLCLSAACSREDAEAAFLAAGLTDEQYRIITDTDGVKYRLRFKILEVAKELLD